VPGVAGGQPTRFRQLATVRAHASAALADSGELDAARERRRGWVDALIASRPAFDAADDDGWYERAALNHDTLNAVLHHALVEQADPKAVGLVGALANYWPYRERLIEGERWSTIALKLAGAAAADVALVELALATMLAYRDRADLAVPLIRDAIANGHLLTRGVYAQHLATAAWCAFLREDSALNFVDGEVLGAAHTDPASQLWSDLLEGRTTLATDGPAAARAQVEALVERAVECGNISVAWLGSALAASCAMLDGDAADASFWLQRRVEYQREAGNVGDLGVTELEANLAANVGEHERAVRLFARSSAYSFRQGSPWPIRHWTEAALARVRRELPVDQFEAAWRAGIAQANANSSQ
jgi:hypothetical protein